MSNEDSGHVGVVSGRVAGKALIEVLGLDGRLVRSITLNADVDDAFTATVVMYIRGDAVPEVAAMLAAHKPYLFISVDQPRADVTGVSDAVKHYALPAEYDPWKAAEELRARLGTD